jgi:hypothetical protein
MIPKTWHFNHIFRAQRCFDQRQIDLAARASCDEIAGCRQGEFRAQPSPARETIDICAAKEL